MKQLWVAEMIGTEIVGGRFGKVVVVVVIGLMENEPYHWLLRHRLCHFKNIFVQMLFCLSLYIQMCLHFLFLVLPIFVSGHFHHFDIKFSFTSRMSLLS